MKTKSPQDVKAMLTDGAEIALLDIREHGRYGEGHPFFSINCPFSSLEYLAPRLAPGRAARVVVFDDDDGIAPRAAARLEALGYENVYVLEGGAPGWQAAGFALFKGVNVPSKAFGEMVEHAMGTPSVTAEQLNEMISDGKPLIVLDGRTPGEYRKMNIPTAGSCPNAELGYRIDGIVPDPETRIVINCAGRTRSIIGAQTLINLGLPNPIAALQNGTQGWQLAGLTLEYGSATKPPQPLSPEALARVRQRALHFAIANQIPKVTLATAQDWLADQSRSTFLLDVRTAEEFAQGHLPGAIHAPGGQLAQATDQWIATRNARIVLCCDLGPRAVTTCHWLRAMGHDAHVLDLDVAGLEAPETGPVPNPALADLAALPRIAPGDVAAALAADVPLLDASAGQDFRAGHVEGAQWVIRQNLPAITAGTQVIVTGSDPARVALIAADLKAAGVTDIRLLEASEEALTAAGLTIVATPDEPTDAEMIDFLFFVHDRHSGALESARRYLEWETGLIAQMDDAERAVFDVTPPVVEAAQ